MLLKQIVAFFSWFYDRMMYYSSCQMVFIFSSLGPTLMLKLLGGGDLLHFRSAQKSSICRNHHPVLSLFLTYQQVHNKSNATGAMCGAGTTNPSGPPATAPIFSGLRVARSLVFYAMFCRSLFVLLSFFF